MDPEIKKLVCDLTVKAYEHHKNHARFEETQRSWMVTAYFAFTGLVYGGLLTQTNQGTPTGGSTELFSSFGLLVLTVHLLLGVFVMVSVSKVSGEFRRHFSRGEAILSDVKQLLSGPDSSEREAISKVFSHVWLETAAIKGEETAAAGQQVRRDIARWSNASMHAYIFALLTALDIYLLTAEVFKRPVISEWPLIFAIVWFLCASYKQRQYLSRIGATGI